jgi:hypothetical protein
LLILHGAGSLLSEYISEAENSESEERKESHAAHIIIIIEKILFISDLLFVTNAIKSMQQHLIQKGDWRGPLQDAAIRRAGTPGTQLS